MALKYKKLVVGSLKTNCYILYDVKTNDAIIIDPGDDADYIQRIVNDNEYKIAAIALTHGHFDHMLAALELVLNYNVPLLASKEDEEIINRVKETTKYFTKVISDPSPTIDVTLDEIKEIKVGNIHLSVIKTPGHTPGGISLYSKSAKLLIVGDVVFKDGIGRTDFKYASYSENMKSIKKILKYPSDTKVLCGHGEDTTVSDVKKMIQINY